MRLSVPGLASVAIALALTLAGCGFQPRGALKVPAELGPIAVATADPYSPLGDGLRRDLVRAGAGTAEPAEGLALLRISAEVWQIRPLSVDAFVLLREVETRYSVEFELLDARGAALLPRQTITLSRDYVYEAVEAFGNPGEQEIIQQELRRDMQAAILRRIDIALRGL